MFPPFEELDGGEDIHADGGDADRPFCIRRKVEDREHEQQDARQHPGGVTEDGEEGEAAFDFSTLGVEGDQCSIEEHDDSKNCHHGGRCAEEFTERVSGEDEEESAGE